MTKVSRARTHTYEKVTRVLLKHLRGNGHRLDRRADYLRRRWFQSLKRLVDLLGQDDDPELRVHVARVLAGAVGINDQVDAMLEGQC